MKTSDKLKQSVQYIKSVGPKRAESFNKIGIATIGDLLHYFPTKYLDRTTLINTVQARQHIINGYEGEMTVIGTVVNKEVIRYSRRQLLKVELQDKAGFFECVWFQGIRFFKDVFNPGDVFAISAKPSVTKYGHLQFAHPDFDRLDKGESQELFNTGKIIPFYRVTKELRAKNIGDFSLRRIIHNAVKNYSQYLEETLPEELISKHSLLNINDTVTQAHFPESFEKLEAAHYRLKYEELFYIETLVALRKHNYSSELKGIRYKVDKELASEFESILPFELTNSQRTVLNEISGDMKKGEPMNRLLQGDVGSGKTIVALIAIFIAVRNGYQTAFMAPTEILAEQHYRTLTKFCDKLGIRISLLTSSTKNKKALLEKLANGDIDLIVGTHALFEKDIKFNKLGFVVIDEQHRFGVAQRYKLIEKALMPDVLVMTATPIPRTLSMTIYGDLDISTITEMPKNRKPITTALRGEKKLPDIYKFINDKVKREGYQTFIVYPLVEESEKSDLQSAEKNFEELTGTYLKDLRVALIHGKKKWDEKESIMQAFANHEYDVLIATTVIEVGIDVPNANIIVINDAFRFGLSQLHQLRGRVGRGDKESYCILVTKNELAVKAKNSSFDFDYMSKQDIEKHKAIIRMNAMVNHTSGFDLAEIDLRLRGPGNIFGTEQTGFPELRFANIISDFDILEKAKEDAFDIVRTDPKLSSQHNTIIKQNLQTSYSESLKYSTIA